MIETAQGSLYTGVTTDVARRFAEHQAGGRRCAKALRGKGPLILRLAIEIGDKRAALQIEYAVKQRTPSQKRMLIARPCQVDQVVIHNRKLK